MIYYISIVSFGTVFLLVLAVFYYFNSRLNRRPITKRLKVLCNSRDTNLDLERKDLLSEISFLNVLLKRISVTRYLSHLIEQAGLRWTVGRLVLLVLFMVAASFYIGSIIGFPFIVRLVMGIGIGCFPFGYIYRKRQRRVKEFEMQFPDCLSLLANVLRAGLGVTVGMELIGEEMPEPSGGEFRKTVTEMNLGLDIKEALEHLNQRIYSPELSLFVASVMVQREAGGNLAEFLNKLEVIIRERFKLKRELKTLTTQTRFSSLIVGFTPIVVAAVIFVINPEYIRILFTNPLGHKLLLMAMILQAFGFLMMKKLTVIRI